MWTETDEFFEATLRMKGEEAERVRLVSELRRQARQGGKARDWRWRIEPGMEEAFRDLQGWLLSSQRDAVPDTAGTASLAQDADRVLCCPLAGYCAEAA